MLKDITSLELDGASGTKGFYILLIGYRYGLSHRIDYGRIGADIGRRGIFCSFFIKGSSLQLT